MNIQLPGNIIPQDKENRAISIFLVLLCLTPIIGAIFPRALAFAPGVFGVIGLITARIVFQEWPRFDKNLFIIFTGLLGFCALSSAWSLNPSESLERVIKLAPICLIGYGLLITTRFYAEKSRQTGFVILPITLGIALGANLFELTFDGPIHHIVRGTEYGAAEFNASVLNRSIVTSVLPVFLAMACLQMFFKDNEKHQSSSIAVLIFLTLAVLFLTDSQSAQLAFIVGLITYLIFPARQRIAWYGLSGIIIALILSAPWLAQYMFKMVAPGIDQVDWMMMGYAPHRMEIWDFVSRYALESPLYGHGIEATKLVESFDTAQLYQRGSDVLHPHNFAIQIWIEFGAIGAIGFCALIYTTMNALKNLPPLVARAGLASFMATLSVAATGYGLWQSWWIGQFFALGSMIIFFHFAVAKHKP